MAGAAVRTEPFWQAAWTLTVWLTACELGVTVMTPPVLFVVVPLVQLAEADLLPKLDAAPAWNSKKLTGPLPWQVKVAVRVIVALVLPLVSPEVLTCLVPMPDVCTPVPPEAVAAVKVPLTPPEASMLAPAPAGELVYVAVRVIV